MFKKYVIFLCFMIFSGCSILHSATDTIMGTYSKGLERQRDKAIVKTVDLGIDECFEKVLATLDNIDADVLKVDFYNYTIFTVVYKHDYSGADTKIFLTSESDQKTKVEIIALSTSIKEFAADRIFSELDKKPIKQ